MIRTTFLGHAAVFLEAPKLRGLVDPFLSGNPGAFSCPGDYDDLTHIFVTHGHGDHVGDTPEIAQRTGATVVSNFELCAFFESEGLKTHPMHIGGAYTFPFGRVKMTPALHGSGFMREGRMVYGGVAGGFLFTLGNKTIYHAGDTGLTMDMQFLRQEKIDLAYLPIGGNFVMDVDDAVRAVELIRPALVVPMHYDTFPVIKADPRDFARKAEAMTEVRVLEPGEVLELE